MHTWAWLCLRKIGAINWYLKPLYCDNMLSKMASPALASARLADMSSRPTLATIVTRKREPQVTRANEGGGTSTRISIEEESRYVE